MNSPSSMGPIMELVAIGWGHFYLKQHNPLKKQAILCLELHVECFPQRETPGYSYDRSYLPKGFLVFQHCTCTFTIYVHLCVPVCTCVPVKLQLYQEFSPTYL